jgi:hypothetical protein
MKTGRNLISLAVAAAFTCAACADGDFIGRGRQDLDSARDRDDDEWPTVPADDVDELPPCSEVEIPSGKVTVFIVEGGGGLLALAIDDELVCVDDSEGMEDVGVPEQLIPDEHHTDPPDDGTLLPDDGTPLPAGPNPGGTGVADGTPLPA